MEITQELLNKVQELAENLTPISEMSVLLDIKEDVLREEILDPASELRRVYYLGMAKVRQQIAGMSWSWLQPAHLKPYSAHMNI